MILNAAASVTLFAIGVAFCFWLIQFRKVEGRQTSEQVFADRYGGCLLCGSLPLGHSSWTLAMAVASREPNRVSELEQLVTRCDWERAETIREFEGTQDEIEYLVIKCPFSNQIALKKILSKSELWLNDRLLEDIPLTTNDQDRLNTLVGSSWEILEATV